MSAPSTPLQSASKSKRRSKGGNDSPSSGKHDGVRWLPVPMAPYCRVPSHKKNCSSSFLQDQVDGVAHQLGLDRAVQDVIKGGVVDTRGPVLYGCWTKLESLNIGEHVPAGKDSALLHPETMKTLGVAIATYVVVRVGRRKKCRVNGVPNDGWQDGAVVEDGDGRKDGPAYVCCKVWPCTSLPLDVVALGWNASTGCGLQDGEVVEVWPLKTPPTKVPVARSVTLTSIEGSTSVRWDRAFSNFLLYSHEGCLLTRHSRMGVSSYLGERRQLKVADITAADRDTSLLSPTAPSIHTLENGLKSLTLSKLAREEEEEDIGTPSGADFSAPNFEVFKLTGQTRLTGGDEPCKSDNKESRASAAKSADLSGVGGVRKQKELLGKLVLHPLNQQLCRSGLAFPRGVLLYGPPGVGKSHLAREVAESSRAHAQILNARQILSGHEEDVLQQTFVSARENSPALIIVDDLDALSPHREGSPGDSQLKALTRLAAHMTDLRRDPPQRHVVVIATTNQLERVDPSLRGPGMFDKEIELPVPTASDRCEILGVLLGLRSHTLTLEQLKSVADRAHGYVGGDLETVCSEAQYKALCRTLDTKVTEVGRSQGRSVKAVHHQQPELNVADTAVTENGGVAGGVEDYRMSEEVSIMFQDMLAALKEVRPSAMREVTLEVPKVKWSDVGGNEEVKQSMREAVEWPLKHPEVFDRLGIRPPKGVLLYGPPGCSKTMVARALATESGLNFMAVKGPELFSKWVGDSERAVRQIFRRARSVAPAIIFFDEIDALAVQRKGEGSSVGDRVLAQLLTEMDGVESAGDVLVVAATNRPDMIDKALLRPGRIDRVIYVPLPSPDTRKEIFEIQRVPKGDDVCSDELVRATEGYSGAEIVSLCQKAALCAMHEDLKTPTVCKRHFDAALSTISPQTDQESLKFYANFRTTNK